MGEQTNKKSNKSILLCCTQYSSTEENSSSLIVAICQEITQAHERTMLVAAAQKSVATSSPMALGARSSLRIEDPVFYSPSTELLADTMILEDDNKYVYCIQRQTQIVKVRVQGETRRHCHTLTSGDITSVVG